jgi:hypothetical protein
MPKTSHYPHFPVTMASTNSISRLVAKAYATALAAGDLIATASAAATDLLLNDVSVILPLPDRPLNHVC